ncbi:MAG: hypothetical protein J7L14_03455, partial [Candidatus Diapherotrites archaeon]|nr:hypothetical protein [Candidatus Diapherotrites archaeon]
IKLPRILVDEIDKILDKRGSKAERNSSKRLLGFVWNSLNQNKRRFLSKEMGTMTLRKVTAWLSPEQIEFLRNNGGISKGVRKAVENLMRHRKFDVTVKLVRMTDGQVITLSWLKYRARDLEDLKMQIQRDLEVLNELEQRKDCIWIFSDLNEKEG